MKVLGISCFYHDSAACLVIDGDIIAAAQEERFTRKKHDPSFPKNAIKYCLKEGKISLVELDAIVFYEKPLLKLERIIETQYSFVPYGIKQFIHAVNLLLAEGKLLLKYKILRELENLMYEGSGDFKSERQKRKLKRLLNDRIYFSEHHLSHAASAFYPSPFQEAAILTVDAVGEWATASLSYGKEKEITILKEMNFPNSVGMLYSAFTYFCGFKVNSGEYKLMGLAPYGNPQNAKKLKNLILSEIVDVKDDGSVWLNQEYFEYCKGLKIINEEKWEKLFGIKPRKPDEKIVQPYCDIAMAAQEILEEIIFRMAKEAKKITGSNNLCMAGGVALNCVANSKLLIRKVFENIWIQPAATDAGGALGAALAYYYSLKETKRTNLMEGEIDKMKGAFLGPSFSKYDILEVIAKYKAIYEEFEDEDKLIRKTAELLAEGKVIGWFQGRMEWGPRALGARSILADPRNPEMIKKLNLKIKFREGFRPFAASVLYEDVMEFFEHGFTSPYMLFVDYIAQKRRKELPDNFLQLPITDRLYFPKSDIPAVTHVDYSVRIQTVHKELNPKFWKLLKEFKKITGYGVLLNTSFNVRGEPIVCSPDDAFRCFIRTQIDYLVIENFIFDRKKQPNLKFDEKFEPD